ncbi:MAG: orotate phosphoribosyltransferase, partial [Rhodospirillaceae bacterium]|nr:orotate phosphoribosyltransferase [Rhodospirillaceae bacterium]
MSATNTKPPSNPAGLEAAKILLDIKAVNFRPQEPYILTSGWASPVYIDCRWLISFPAERTRMMELAVETLKRESDFAKIDA